MEKNSEILDNEHENKWPLRPSKQYIKLKEKEIVEDRCDSLGFSMVPLKRQQQYRKEGMVSDEGIYHIELIIKVIPLETIPYSSLEVLDELKHGYLKRIEQIYATARLANDDEIDTIETNENVDILMGD